MIGPTSVLSWVMLVGLVILGPIVAAISALCFGTNLYTISKLGEQLPVTWVLLRARSWPARLWLLRSPPHRGCASPGAHCHSWWQGDLRGRRLLAVHSLRPPRHRRDGRPRVFLSGVLRIRRLHPVPGEAGPASGHRRGDDRHRRAAARRRSGLSSPAQRRRFLPPWFDGLATGPDQKVSTANPRGEASTRVTRVTRSVGDDSSPGLRYTVIT
jgi:hypothetical protein